MSTDSNRDQLRKKLRLSWIGIPFFILMTAYNVHSLLTNFEIPVWFNAAVVILCIAGIGASIGGVIINRRKLHKLE